jgi:cytochrome c peroxidase
MKRTICLFVLFCFIFSAYKAINEYRFTVPHGWPKPIYDFSKNPLTVEKTELGRALFYETLLSRNNTVSCNNCHSQFTSFAHIDHALSHGIDNKTGTRNAPALMNLAWQNTFMWDGAINHLDMQPLAPISKENEMNSNMDSVVRKLQQTRMYPLLFYKAFGDSIITGEYTLKAISQFMLTIISANSKYDNVMRKQTAFTAQENSGYKLFKKNCSSCHTEPLFSNYQFENNGLSMDTTLNDFGRVKVSNKPSDSLKFKVPTLRNIEFSYPYMHDGRFKRLSEVLNHYTSGIAQSKTLAIQLQKPIILTSNEKVDLIAFLLTLTDKEFLFNSKYAYPRQLFFNPER